MRTHRAFHRDELVAKALADRKTVCVDLDGTLASYDGWKGSDHIGEPLSGAVEFTHKLSEFADVVIYTTRTNTDPKLGNHEGAFELLKAWLDKHGFAYHSIYQGQGKPLAAAYVDDRAVACVPQRDGVAAFQCVEWCRRLCKDAK